VPSAVVHGALPLLFLLATRRLDARKVWILWPLTFLPDLDYFFGLHRAALTNVFVLLSFVAALAYAWRARKPDLMQWMVVALVYLVSHFLMDMMTGGIVPLYPLSDYTVCYYYNIDIVTATNTPYFDYGPCSHDGIPTVAARYPWLSDTDAAILAFLLPFGLGMGAWSAWRMRRDGQRSLGPEGDGA
jgi:hypothetical protein